MFPIFFLTAYTCSMYSMFSGQISSQRKTSTEYWHWTHLWNFFWLYTSSRHNPTKQKRFILGADCFVPWPPFKLRKIQQCYTYKAVSGKLVFSMGMKWQQKKYRVCFLSLLITLFMLLQDPAKVYYRVRHNWW